MYLTFDIYEQDPTSNGDPDFITNIAHEASNATHLLQFVAGYCNENKYHIIRNMRIYP